MEEIGKYPLRYFYVDISPPGANVISIYILVGINRIKELDAEFDFSIFI
jgi:hypothetical protein